MKKVLPANAVLIPANANKVFSGAIFDVYQWPQEMFDGSSATFEMLRRPDTVQVLAVRDGRIVMVDDEQPNHRSVHFPGGRTDHDDSDWLETAKRELLEETGMRFKNWRLIMVIQPMMKIEQFVAWFLATDFDEQLDQNLDNGEKIKVLEQSFDEIRDRVVDMDDPTLNYALPLLVSVNSLDELLALPEFRGQEVDR